MEMIERARPKKYDALGIRNDMIYGHRRKPQGGLWDSPYLVLVCHAPLCQTCWEVPVISVVLPYLIPLINDALCE